MDYRVEIEYRTRRVVYVYADSREEAKEQAKTPANWADNDEPHELVSPADKVLIKSVRKLD